MLDGDDGGVFCGAIRAAMEPALRRLGRLLQRDEPAVWNSKFTTTLLFTDETFEIIPPAQENDIARFAYVHCTTDMCASSPRLLTALAQSVLRIVSLAISF